MSFCCTCGIYMKLNRHHQFSLGVSHLLSLFCRYHPNMLCEGQGEEEGWWDSREERRQGEGDKVQEGREPRKPRWWCQEIQKAVIQTSKLEDSTQAQGALTPCLLMSSYEVVVLHGCLGSLLLPLHQLELDLEHIWVWEEWRRRNAIF